MSADVLGRCFLPPDVPVLVGRDGELGALLQMPRRAAKTTVVCAVEGMAGVGKTALAVHAAHRMADDFPDGQFYVDLHGYSDGYLPVEPAAALGALLCQLGVPSDRMPDGVEDRAALWRAELAGLRALVVVDNAADASHVRPLLPLSAGSLLVVTSRRRLHGLDSVYALALDVLSECRAVELFAQSAGCPELAADGAVQQVVRLCGHLPVAIRVAAARLRQCPSWTVAQLAEHLGEERRRLSQPALGEPFQPAPGELPQLDVPGLDGVTIGGVTIGGVTSGVVASFVLSQRQLTALPRRLFLLLGQVPGPDFDDHVAAALAGVPLADARRALSELLDAHLLLRRRSCRYAFHDLLRQHARRSAAHEESGAGLQAAAGRLLDYYLHTAAAAADQLMSNRRGRAVDVCTVPRYAPVFTDRAEAMDWLLAERVNLIAAVNHAANHGWPMHAWQLAHALWWFFHLRGHTADLLTTQSVALRAVQTVGDRRGEATALTNLGSGLSQAGRPGDAVPLLERALSLHRGLGDRLSEAGTLLNLGAAYYRVGRHTEAIDCSYQARTVYQELDDQWGEVTALNNVGVAYNQAGEPGSAIVRLTEALRLGERLGPAPGLARMLSNYGRSLTLLGRPAEALGHLRRALAQNRRTGARWDEGTILSDLGLTHARLGEFSEAFRCHQHALAMIGPMAQHGIEGELRNKAGESHRLAGRFDAALEHHQRALALAARAGERYQQACALDGIARCHHELGDAELARRHWQQALVIFDELQHRDAQLVRAALA